MRERNDVLRVSDDVLRGRNGKKWRNGIFRRRNDVLRVRDDVFRRWDDVLGVEVIFCCYVFWFIGMMVNFCLSGDCKYCFLDCKGCVVCRGGRFFLFL